jgi:hypothetical protein
VILRRETASAPPDLAAKAVTLTPAPPAPAPGGYRGAGLAQVALRRDDEGATAMLEALLVSKWVGAPIRIGVPIIRGRHVSPVATPGTQSRVCDPVARARWRKDSG